MKGNRGVRPTAGGVAAMVPSEGRVSVVSDGRVTCFEHGVGAETRTEARCGSC